MDIVSHRYGKERVRLTWLDRSVEPHRVVICSVGISLEGDFEGSYTEGDNRKVVATDSMKNTVYVLARERGVGSIEELAILLATHFVDGYDAVHAARVTVEREPWSPIDTSDGPHPAAQVRSGTELHVARAGQGADGLHLTSGLRGLQVIKTARSGFSDFHRDRFTTLRDTDDRLLATSIDAHWRVDAEPDRARDEARRDRVRSLLLETFAEHRSRSVQETLQAMGSAVLEALAEVTSVQLRLPNQHHLLVDLEPFGLDNPNRVFVATDEPFGNIEATLERTDGTAESR